MPHFETRVSPQIPVIVTKENFVHLKQHFALYKKHIRITTTADVQQ